MSDLPTGKWINVPRDKVVAVDTYKDGRGVLRDVRDHSIVVWHWRRKGYPKCTKKIRRASEIIYLENGAPWCPWCLPQKLEFDAAQAQQAAREQKENK